MTQLYHNSANSVNKINKPKPQRICWNIQQAVCKILFVKSKKSIFLLENFFAVYSKDGSGDGGSKTPNLEKPRAEATSEKIAVLYFSCTETTKNIATKISSEFELDIFRIEPKIAYSQADLNYNNSNCRANTEQNDSSARPEISSIIDNFDSYTTFFMGYPIQKYKSRRYSWFNRQKRLYFRKWWWKCKNIFW